MKDQKHETIPPSMKRCLQIYRHKIGYAVGQDVGRKFLIVTFRQFLHKSVSDRILSTNPVR